MTRVATMGRPGRRLVVALALAALPVACASPSPTLYTLAVVPGREHTGAPARIELRMIALARYLDRSQIVRSSEEYRLDLLTNEWWGEPLDSMLSRVLVQGLSQRLPASMVFAENTAITATPDVSVELNLQRLDQDRSGAVVLVAQVGITGRTTLTRNVRLAVTPGSAGTPGLVSAMSAAVGQLADAIATLLASPAMRERPARSAG